MTALLWFALGVLGVAVVIYLALYIVQRLSGGAIPGGIVMAVWIGFVIVVAILALGRFVPAFAQDTVVVTAPPDASPWNEFLAAIMPSLIGLAMAAISAAGIFVSAYARKVGGPRAEQATNATYQIIVSQAAGWILARYGTSATLSPAGQQIKAAIEYIRASYPKVDGIEPHEGRLADDIIAAFGQLAAGKNK